MYIKGVEAAPIPGPQGPPGTPVSKTSAVESIDNGVEMTQAEVKSRLKNKYSCKE